jgi:hypothetical protein
MEHAKDMILQDVATKNEERVLAGKLLLFVEEELTLEDRGRFYEMARRNMRKIDRG